MDELAPLDVFALHTHGDRHERAFWPLLRDRFPSYEIVWRRLIVPLTFRVDRSIPADDPLSIQLRPDLPVEPYERMTMAHYSVFYFVGRAAKLFADLPRIEYPEDILFLLDSAGDNCQCFLRCVNNIARDSIGRAIFGRATIARFTNTTPPFGEISAYRDVLLHNAVIGRAEHVDKTYLPRWHPETAQTPLEHAKRSWRAAAALGPHELVSTRTLINRLITEACAALEQHWQTVVTAALQPAFQHKISTISRLKMYLPLHASDLTTPAASGSYITSTITTSSAVTSAMKDGAASQTGE
jgi:hypothetical protein